MNNEEFVLPDGAMAMLKQLEQPSKQVHSVQDGGIHGAMLRTVQESARWVRVCVQTRVMCVRIWRGVVEGLMRGGRLTFPLLDPQSGADTYTRCLYAPHA